MTKRTYYIAVYYAYDLMLNYCSYLIYKICFWFLVFGWFLAERV